MLRGPCLRYIHFMGSYGPLGLNLGDLYASLQDAPADIVDQCQIDTWKGLKRVAAARGVRPREVMKEFKQALRGLPTASQLARLSPNGATRLLMASHQGLHVSDEDMIARVDRLQEDTLFGMVRREGMKRQRPPSSAETMAQFAEQGADGDVLFRGPQPSSVEEEADWLLDMLDDEDA